MKLNKKGVLLYIHPAGAASAVSVADDLSRRLACELSRVVAMGSVNYAGRFCEGERTMGVHVCTGAGCGARSRSYDLKLPCGLATNSLALHYMMYHRDEVPKDDLNKVQSMPDPRDFRLEDFDERGL